MPISLLIAFRISNVRIVVELVLSISYGIRTRSEHIRQSQPPAEVDPIMHREDLNFIAFMYTIEQLDCERLVN